LVKETEKTPAASNTIVRAETLASHFMSRVPPKNAAKARNQLDARGKATC
jgi:hypothetical protein